MSLFGGETDQPGSTLGSESSGSPATSSASVPLSSSLEAQSLQNAQYIPTPFSNIDADDENEDEDGTGEDLGSQDEDHASFDNEPSRPNRFVGPKSTWRRYTAAERGIAASLSLEESGDLAAHLYNAHALKRRVRLPAEDLTSLKDWQGRDSWLKKGEELVCTDVAGDVQTELLPSKRWTAWPLPAEYVPAANEKFAQGRATRMGESWGLQEAEAGIVLREEMLALFSGLAKERFVAKYANESKSHHQIENESRSSSRPASRNGHLTKSRLSAVGIKKSDYDKDVDEDDEFQVEGGSGHEGESSHLGDSDHALKHRPTRKRGRKPGPRSTRPAILADDDKARRILQPTINSLLAQLDSVAAAIRGTRLNHFGRGAYSDTSGSEFMSDADSLPQRSRSNSRPRSRLKGASRQKQACQAKSGLPKRRLSSNDTDHASDFDPGVGFDTTSKPTNSRNQGRKRRRSRSTTSKDSADSFLNREASMQVGLLDWSEVLGIASMSGWSPAAISRAAQRCAALFGEQMSFRAFDDSLAADAMPDPILYAPDAVPAPDVLGLQGGNSAKKRPLFDPGTLRCPHTDCYGHGEDFPLPYRVVEHVRRAHGYDPRTNDSDNEERRHGGVHRDGFLQPITAKQGWLGYGRSKSANERRSPRPPSGRSKSKGSTAPDGADASSDAPSPE